MTKPIIRSAQYLSIFLLSFYICNCSVQKQTSQTNNHQNYVEYKELSALKAFSYAAVQGYAKRFSNVDPKFEGVINFGKALQEISNKDTINIENLTQTSKIYWRAVLEMVPTDPSILFTHAHLLIARGEVAKAETYFLLGTLSMDEVFRKELSQYKIYKTKLDNRVTYEMQIGIRYHDQKEYEKAIEAYDHVILQYPNCAWPYYEKGFSYLMQDENDPDLEKIRIKMYSKCRKHNPFFWKAYQGSDQEVIQKLMVLGKKVIPYISGKKRDIESLKMFAEGCEEIKLYTVAAHSRWKLVRLDPVNMDSHIKIFLDLLSKCGCKETGFFRNQFVLNEG